MKKILDPSLTRCLVGDRTCSLIINGGSETNFVSASRVEKLGLPVMIHPHPYVLQMLGDFGEVRVSERILLNFNIGTYSDQIMCDVVPLHTTHIILGKPWQCVRNVEYNIRRNLYSFTMDGKKVVILSLSLEKIRKDQMKLKKEFEEESESESEKSEAGMVVELHEVPLDKKVEKEGELKVEIDETPNSHVHDNNIGEGVHELRMVEELVEDVVEVKDVEELFEGDDHVEEVVELKDKNFGVLVERGEEKSLMVREEKLEIMKYKYEDPYLIRCETNDSHPHLFKFILQVNHILAFGPHYTWPQEFMVRPSRISKVTKYYWLVMRFGSNNFPFDPGGAKKYQEQTYDSERITLKKEGMMRIIGGSTGKINYLSRTSFEVYFEGIPGVKEEDSRLKTSDQVK